MDRDWRCKKKAAALLTVGTLWWVIACCLLLQVVAQLCARGLLGAATQPMVCQGVLRAWHRIDMLIETLEQQHYETYDCNCVGTCLACRQHRCAAYVAPCCLLLSRAEHRN